MNVSKQKVEAILEDLKKDISGFCCESEVTVMVKGGVVYSIRARSLQDYMDDNFDEEPVVYDGGIEE